MTEQGGHVDHVADRRLDLRSSETVVLFDHVADHAISIIRSGPLRTISESEKQTCLNIPPSRDTRYAQPDWLASSKQKH